MMPPNGLRNPQGRERKTIKLFKAFKIKRDVALVGFTLCYAAGLFLLPFGRPPSLPLLADDFFFALLVDAPPTLPSFFA